MTVRKLVLIVLGAAMVACATSPTGRRQLHLFPEREVAAMGARSFAQIKVQTPIDRTPVVNGQVQCVVDALTSQLPEDMQTGWDVVVFRQPKTINAFALPGKKIGVYTGLLQVTSDSSELATVLGHEIGHVLAHHSNERLSEVFLAQGGLEAARLALGQRTPNHDLLLAALGLGLKVGVILPFSRRQESEADELGLTLMARAGFNPDASLIFWHKMVQKVPQGPPEILSTHPASARRIKDLQFQLPAAQVQYRRALRLGLNPRC